MTTSVRGLMISSRSNKVKKKRMIFGRETCASTACRLPHKKVSPTISMTASVSPFQIIGIQ